MLKSHETQQKKPEKKTLTKENAGKIRTKQNNISTNNQKPREFGSVIEQNFEHLKEQKEIKEPLKG